MLHMYMFMVAGLLRALEVLVLGSERRRIIQDRFCCWREATHMIVSNHRFEADQPTDAPPNYVSGTKTLAARCLTSGGWLPFQEIDAPTYSRTKLRPLVVWCLVSGWRRFYWGPRRVGNTILLCGTKEGRFPQHCMVSAE